MHSKPVSIHEDFLISNCIDRILGDFGDDVFVKPKILHKFGRTTNANADVKTTVAKFQSTGVVNEVLATGNSIDMVVSDSTADVGDINSEGHYLDADLIKVFYPQLVTLNGQTPVALSQPYHRATRGAVADGTILIPSTNLVGNVYFYDSSVSTAVSAGVPIVPSATKLMIAAGNNQSEKAATSLSGRDYWLLSSVYAAIDRQTGSGVTAKVEVEYRAAGGVWLPLGLELQLRTDGQNQIPLPLNPYRIVPKDSDVRMVATASANGTVVSGYMAGYLALVQRSL